MTRKDFELIAATIKRRADDHVKHDEQQVFDALACLAEDFAQQLANTNPRFERARFLKACGVA